LLPSIVGSRRYAGYLSGSSHPILQNHDFAGLREEFAFVQITGEQLHARPARLGGRFGVVNREQKRTFLFATSYHLQVGIECRELIDATSVSAPSIRCSHYAVKRFGRSIIG